MNAITFGQLLDLLTRARHQIVQTDFILHGDLSPMDRPRAGLCNEIDAVERLLRDEIGGSHMGTGADVVVIERGDA